MDFWKEFQGPNSGYVLELYDRWLRDPQLVDPEARAFFENWQPPLEPGLPVGQVTTAGNIHMKEAVPAEKLDMVVAVANLAQAIRSYGHLQAQLDPLGSPPPGDPALEPGHYGLNDEILRNLPARLVGGPAAENAANALEAVQELSRIYSGSLGFDYGHVDNPEERAWLRDTAESGRFRPGLDPVGARRLLERLTQVEVFERFLHRTYPGKTRFSSEGVDMMIPILDEIISSAASDGICMVFLGMAHRGRLNVLAHILNKPYAQILAEFKDPGGDSNAWYQLGWTGDVKYHKGARRAYDDGRKSELVISMPPNPSHLEFIDPVLEGMARAADTVMDHPGKAIFYPKASLPILIHGDASFPGQGVVAETLNISRLPGYSTAGSIHIISNNQLGYTATQKEGRSSRYSSDFAKGLKIPVIHVNADDPEACLEAACTAFSYREEFQKDFLIDLIGYRRYGHNEGDEPSFTQPLMYQKIENHPTVREIWGSKLVERKWIDPSLPDELNNGDLERMQAVHNSLHPELDLDEEPPQPPPPGAARHVHTAVPVDRLQELNQAILNVPGDFHLNKKLDRPRRRRASAFDNPEETSIDWAAAEDLAFASILEEGTPIRITGQDVERGTFSQRHAVLHDVENGQEYIPLQSLPQARAAFEIHNSPLMESGAVGFEFGYNIQAPERFVVWEAQYGDFITVAQTMVDEFIISARAKWGQTPSLVLLLPHGNEGQGPDHSSGRPERFLQMAAETNFRLAYPTTAAQYFHLLRRQVALLQTDPLPLVVLTPKSLLRHPISASKPIDLAEGSWQPVIGDNLVDSAQVRRLVLCSGKVYVDLVSSPLRPETMDLAIARVEQLYPFPADDLESVFGCFPNLEQIYWVQEEPKNQGTWEFERPHLEELIHDRWPLHYIGRPASSSPAEGSTNWYAANQRALIERVYNGLTGPVEDGVLEPGGEVRVPQASGEAKPPPAGG